MYSLILIFTFGIGSGDSTVVEGFQRETLCMNAGNQIQQAVLKNPLPRPRVEYICVKMVGE